MSYELMTHEPWCEWYFDEEYEKCTCGYREDLIWEPEEPMHASTQPGQAYGT